MIPKIVKRYKRTNLIVICRKCGNNYSEVNNMEKITYSIQEVAELLGISKSYTYELVRNGTIPAIELGRKKIIPKERFLAWVNDAAQSKI